MTYTKEFFRNKIEIMPKLVAENTNNNRYKSRTALFRLIKYADGFIYGKTDIRFIIMYGLRGIGKTTMLFQLYHYLLEKTPKDNIIYLSADQLQLQGDEKSSMVYESIKAFIENFHNSTIESLDKKIFVFMDEAHFDKKWAIAAKTIFDSTKNIFLIITGSSAISLNINTDTARRSIKEPIFPVSFLEYQIIKNQIYPMKGTAETLKKLLLNPNLESIKFLVNIKNDLEKQFSKSGNKIENEVDEFMCGGGFGFSFQSTNEITYRRILDMIDRIIKQDIPHVANFDTKTFPDMWRILGALAKKFPGETSHNKLFKNLNLSSPTLVKSILDAMEKTQLLISVKPYPKNGGKNPGYPFKYYFMCPAVLTALQYANGKTGDDPECKSLLRETIAANTLYRVTKTLGIPFNLLYDPIKESNVDFLIQNPISGRVIPIEVGFNKDDAQVKNAIKNYNSNYGIVVSNSNEIELKDNILRVPLWLFLYS